jgi:hypothetical protein
MTYGITQNASSEIMWPSREKALTKHQRGVQHAFAASKDGSNAK